MIHATLVPLRAAAAISLALSCAKPAQLAPPGGDRLTGRWVMVNSPVGYHFWNDSVESVMYPPQAPAPSRYRVVSDTLVLVDGDRITRHRFVLRGDTLRLSWPTTAPAEPMTRIQGTGASGLIGSWRGRSGNTTTFLTFRSDSAMVMEVGIPWPARRGDTLVMMTERGQAVRTVFYFANGRLNARSLDDRQVRTMAFVRRPWGCFGIKALDRDAAECR